MNKRHILNITSIIIIAIFLLTPVSQFYFHFIPGNKLHGTERAKKPEWLTPSFFCFKTHKYGISIDYNKLSILKTALNKFQSGAYQKISDDYLTRGSALWDWMVRINNQIAYSIFNQSTLGYSKEVFLGKEKQLMQPMYLDSFNRQKTAKYKLLKKRAKAIKKLQTLLKERNIPLLVSISPNVLELYPELVPDAFLDESRLSRKNSYEITKKLLQKRKVNLIDHQEILSSLKNQFNFRFFEKSGSHWNNVASCIATNNLLQKINELTHKNVKFIPCAPITFEPPHKAEQDLLDIENLLFPKLEKEAPYVPAPEKMYDTPPLRILFIGSSFNFAIQEHLYKRNIADTKLYFYYRQLRDGKGVMHPLNFKKLDWENDILKNDIIILESRLSALGAVGHAFPSHAIRYLKKAQLSNAERDL